MPLGAVLDDGRRSGVWVFDSAKSTVHFQPVELMRVSSETAVISGLGAGDPVVALGAHLLHEGARVRTAPNAEASDALQSLGGRRPRTRRHAVLLVLLACGRHLAFDKLGRAEDPTFTVKTMAVSTAWPGATTDEMQGLVAEPLEKRLQELVWYDRVETTTRPGYAYM